MSFYRPPSFFTLLVLSFLLVCLPLLAALYSSVRIMDSLVQQSVAAVHSSVERATRSREIIELLQDQERMARLYNVLGDTEQLLNVNAAQSEIEKALDSLLPADGQEKLTVLIEELKSKAQYVNAVLNRFTSDPELLRNENEKVLSMYKQIGKLAYDLQKLNARLMMEEVAGLRLKVDVEKKQLIWQTYALVMFAVIFGIIFISLIFKPIKQINGAIEHLGDGNFQTAIAVSGPRDLQDLGKKLDWLRKRLAKLDREKVKLIAHISHELKTPLASIKEGTGLLGDELVGPINRPQRDVVAILEKNCAKLQKLIEDILNFNMARAKENSVPGESLQLNEVIEEVIKDHQNSVMARNIQLDVRLASVAMYGNRNQLKTIFDNLLSNAVKFTPDEGRIAIRLRASERMATCLVEDSGTGVEESERSQIFSPFYKGNGAEKSLIKGSGLGLAISREYAESHGGTVRLLRSKKGARFAVTFPLKKETGA